MTYVPCKSCTLCCHKTNIMLMPEQGDDVASYEHEIVNDVPVLKHKPDGACIYLTEQRCSIHERAPVTCREFDCRRFYAGKGPAERRWMLEHGQIDPMMFEVGKALLDELELHQSIALFNSWVD